MELSQEEIEYIEAYNRLKADFPTWKKALEQFLFLTRSKSSPLLEELNQIIIENNTELEDILGGILNASSYDDDTLSLLREIYSLVRKALEVVTDSKVASSLISLREALRDYFKKIKEVPYQEDYQYYPGKSSYEDYVYYYSMSPKERYKKLLAEGIYEVLWPSLKRKLEEDKKKVMAEAIRAHLKGEPLDLNALVEEEEHEVNPKIMEETAKEMLEELQEKKKEYEELAEKDPIKKYLRLKDEKEREESKEKFVQELSKSIEEETGASKAASLLLKNEWVKKFK
ncbi:MAG: hypothetical protein QXI39_01210 [Candidatus Bathyarchaeia archaeon]